MLGNLLMNIVIIIFFIVYIISLVKRRRNNEKKIINKQEKKYFFISTLLNLLALLLMLFQVLPLYIPLVSIISVEQSTYFINNIWFKKGEKTKAGRTKITLFFSHAALLLVNVILYGALYEV